jgi:hypothetical protein
MVHPEFEDASLARAVCWALAAAYDDAPCLFILAAPRWADKAFYRKLTSNSTRAHVLCSIPKGRLMMAAPRLGSGWRRGDLLASWCGGDGCRCSSDARCRCCSSRGHSRSSGLAARRSRLGSGWRSGNSSSSSVVGRNRRLSNWGHRSSRGRSVAGRGRSRSSAGAACCGGLRSGWRRGGLLGGSSRRGGSGAGRSRCIGCGNSRSSTLAACSALHSGWHRGGLLASGLGSSGRIALRASPGARAGGADAATLRAHAASAAALRWRDSVLASVMTQPRTAALRSSAARALQTSTPSAHVSSAARRGPLRRAAARRAARSARKRRTPAVSVRARRAALRSSAARALQTSTPAAQVRGVARGSVRLQRLSAPSRRPGSRTRRRAQDIHRAGNPSGAQRSSARGAQRADALTPACRRRAAQRATRSSGGA